MITSLTMLFERDLDKLIKEVSLYSNEAIMWIAEEQISNSAGNLAIHLVGNLQHYIGATLGNTGYARRIFKLRITATKIDHFIAQIQATLRAAAMVEINRAGMSAGKCVACDANKGRQAGPGRNQ